MKRLYIQAGICLLATTQALAGSVYVSSTAGSNITGTGSMNSPYQTIAYATAQASANDTIKIYPGTYMETTDITVDQSLTFMKEGTGEVVIDGDSRSSLIINKNIFKIDNASDVTIQGLVMQNLIGAGSRGVLVTGSGSNINIEGNTFINIGWVDSNLIQLPLALEGASAIEVRGDMSTALTDVDIVGNTVLYCALGTSEAISVNGNVDGFLVANNTIDQVSNIGIDVAGNYSWANPFPAMNQAHNGTIKANIVSHAMSGLAASAGIYIDGAYDIVVEQNTLFENAVGISVGAEQMLGIGAHAVSGNIIRNNVIYDNAVAGIMIGSGTAAMTVENTMVTNNTLINNRTGATINGVMTIGGDGPSVFGDQWGGEVHLMNSEDVTFENNLVSASAGKMNIVALDGYTMENFKSDYNLYYNGGSSVALNINSNVSFNGSTSLGGNYNQLADFSTATGLEMHSIVSAPGFVDETQDDYDLDDNSGAINKANPTPDASVGTTDFAGNPRVQNGRLDMGAFENQKVTSVSGVGNGNRSLTLYPNPTNGLMTIRSTANITSVSISDVQGKVVMSVVPVKNTIDVSSLPTGVYVVRATDVNNAVFTQKIMKY